MFRDVRHGNAFSGRQDADLYGRRGRPPLQSRHESPDDLVQYSFCFSHKKAQTAQKESFQHHTLRKPIPKGLSHTAQGCDERATLGKQNQRNRNPNGVVTRFEFRTHHPITSSQRNPLRFRTTPSSPAKTAPSLFVLFVLFCGHSPQFAFIQNTQNPNHRHSRSAGKSIPIPPA